jgi:uncharacterized protein
LIDESTARRLAIEGALLAGPRPPATAKGILEVATRLGGLQIDPTRTIERTEQLVVWSRLGNYDRAILERLIWKERRLFEHGAFYIPIERLPEIRYQQKAFATGQIGWAAGAIKWIAANARFHASILDQLRTEGPLPSRAMDTSAVEVGWKSTGWTNDRSITRMLEFMDGRGEIAISGRQGSERLWDLPERVLPPPGPDLSYNEYLRRRSLLLARRMGVATLNEIRDRSPVVPDVDRAALAEILNELVEEGRLIAVDKSTYRHADANLDVEPKLTTFLSPFEPLIKDRARTEKLFGFRYKLEMYVPKEKREFGHYTLPVLHHDRLLGRLDAEMDRRAKVLRVNKMHWETTPDASEAAAVDDAIADLARWLGADSVSRD